MGTHLDDPKCTSDYVFEMTEQMVNKYGDRFPNIKQIVAIDATKNVTNLKDALKNVANELPTMGEPMPQSYVELEKLLIEERKEKVPPIISWKEWVHLGSIASISDPSTLLRATNFLHNLVFLSIKLM